jgi:hypothetical protein
VEFTSYTSYAGYLELRGPAMGHDVSGIELRLTIEALLHTAGAHYATVLQQAGMSQYLATLPPPTEASGCSAAEYGRLIATAYDVLGEPFTRRILRQIGTEAVESALRGPAMQRLIVEGSALAPERQMAWLVRVLARLIEQYWARPILSEDAGAHYIAMTTCSTCAGISGVSAPICGNFEALYAGMAAQLTGRPLQVAEVECVAMGAPHCRFAFYKPGA